MYIVKAVSDRTLIMNHDGISTYHCEPTVTERLHFLSVCISLTFRSVLVILLLLSHGNVSPRVYKIAILYSVSLRVCDRPPSSVTKNRVGGVGSRVLPARPSRIVFVEISVSTSSNPLGDCCADYPFLSRTFRTRFCLSEWKLLNEIRRCLPLLLIPLEPVFDSH